MHESESSPSHSVLESKSSHESLNLAHESDSSPSPGLEYYNTGILRVGMRMDSHSYIERELRFCCSHVGSVRTNYKLPSVA